MSNDSDRQRGSQKGHKLPAGASSRDFQESAASDGSQSKGSHGSVTSSAASSSDRLAAGFVENGVGGGCSSGKQAQRQHKAELTGLRQQQSATLVGRVGRSAGGAVDGASAVGATSDDVDDVLARSLDRTHDKPETAESDLLDSDGGTVAARGRVSETRLPATARSTTRPPKAPEPAGGSQRWTRKAGSSPSPSSSSKPLARPAAVAQRAATTAPALAATTARATRRNPATSAIAPAGAGGFEAAASGGYRTSPRGHCAAAAAARPTHLSASRLLAAGSKLASAASSSNCTDCGSSGGAGERLAGATRARPAPAPGATGSANAATMTLAIRGRCSCGQSAATATRAAKSGAALGKPARAGSAGVASSSCNCNCNCVSPINAFAKNPRLAAVNNDATLQHKRVTSTSCTTRSANSQFASNISPSHNQKSLPVRSDSRSEQKLTANKQLLQQPLASQLSGTNCNGKRQQQLQPPPPTTKAISVSSVLLNTTNCRRHLVNQLSIKSSDTSKQIKRQQPPLKITTKTDHSNHIHHNTVFNSYKMVDQAVIDKLEAGFAKLQAATPEQCHSLLKKYLTREVLDKLKNLKTAMGATLLDVVQSGFENLDSGVGVYAPDAESYTLFADLFNSIIEDYHGGFKPTDKHPASDFGDLESLVNVDPNNEFVISTRVRCGRSLKGYPFNPCLTEAQYKEMQDKVSSTLKEVGGDLAGTYYPLTGMTKETQQQLIDDHFLFKEGDRFLQAANACRYWPTGRGIYHNAAKTFLVWVNEEDHLRIISMQKGGDLKTVFKRLVEGARAIEAKVPFSRDDRLGFLTFCPTNLGTTIRASVHIKLPKLAADRKKLEEVAGRYNLQVRGTSGEHTESVGGVYDISNKRRLGLTEYQAVKEMQDGIVELIKIEKSL